VHCASWPLVVFSGAQLAVLAVPALLVPTLEWK